jgi:hypothetical protein
MVLRVFCKGERRSRLSHRGQQRQCSEQHLARYLCEFEFRHNHRTGLGFNDGERTALAMKGIEGKRLTYSLTK